MTFHPTQRTLFWGTVLGAIFGAGIGIGLGGGWSFVDTASLPLLATERFLSLRGMIILGGIGAAIGMMWGLVCAVVVMLKRRTLFIVLGLMGLFYLIELLFNRFQMGGFALLLFIFGLPTLIGYTLLQLYLRLKRPIYFIPLVLIAGFMFGHLPWSMNGRDFERAAYRTEEYAQSHAIANHRIAVTQAESGGYRTELHLEDGSILYCYAWPSESEFKECTPTPQ